MTFGINDTEGILSIIMLRAVIPDVAFCIPMLSVIMLSVVASHAQHNDTQYNYKRTENVRLCVPVSLIVPSDVTLPSIVILCAVLASFTLSVITMSVVMLSGFVLVVIMLSKAKRHP
jgi:hypothetical protein